MAHLSTDQLNAGLDTIRSSPSDDGVVELIVRRPQVDQREVLDRAELLVGEGLAGDDYLARGNPKTPDGKAHPEAQITLMNSRAIDILANGDKDRWPLAGDQLYVDFDLTASNCPSGTRLSLGSAVLEVSAKPHTGCAKFAERFGLDAAKWVNSDDDLRLRGINAMVVEAGTVSRGDAITKIT